MGKKKSTSAKKNKKRAPKSERALVLTHPCINEPLPRDYGYSKFEELPDDCVGEILSFLFFDTRKPKWSWHQCHRNEIQTVWKLTLISRRFVSVLVSHFYYRRLYLSRLYYNFDEEENLSQSLVITRHSPRLISNILQMLNAKTVVTHLFLPFCTFDPTFTGRTLSALENSTVRSERASCENENEERGDGYYCFTEEPTRSERRKRRAKRGSNRRAKRRVSCYASSLRSSRALCGSLRSSCVLRIIATLLPFAPRRSLSALLSSNRVLLANSLHQQQVLKAVDLRSKLNGLPIGDRKGAPIVRPSNLLAGCGSLDPDYLVTFIKSTRNTIEHFHLPFRSDLPNPPPTAEISRFDDKMYNALMAMSRAVARRRDVSMGGRDEIRGCDCKFSDAVTRGHEWVLGFPSCMHCGDECCLDCCENIQKCQSCLDSSCENCLSGSECGECGYKCDSCMSGYPCALCDKCPQCCEGENHSCDECCANMCDGCIAEKGGRDYVLCEDCEAEFCAECAADKFEEGTERCLYCVGREALENNKGE